MLSVKNHVNYWTKKILASKTKKGKNDNGRNAQKRKAKNVKTLVFWLHMDFISINILVHPLANKPWQIKVGKKGITLRSYIWRGKLTFTYSPSLSIAWKSLLMKAKVTTIVQYYNLVACFDNNWILWNEN